MGETGFKQATMRDGPEITWEEGKATPALPSKIDGIVQFMIYSCSHGDDDSASHAELHYNYVGEVEVKLAKVFQELAKNPNGTWEEMFHVSIGASVNTKDLDYTGLEGVLLVRFTEAGVLMGSTDMYSELD